MGSWFNRDNFRFLAESIAVMSWLLNTPMTMTGADVPGGDFIAVSFEEKGLSRHFNTRACRSF
ncbi:MAG: hypothetical protein M1294_06495 [Firmicutes bacterium]|nr:hypothetical protein [Bacillota bacterium]